MKRIIYIIIAALICLSGVVNAQQREIQGVVRDKDGKMPGVSVVEKEVPANVVSTNSDGKFKIQLRGKSGILLFRSVGYQPREMAAAANMNVILVNDISDLDEIVVVGFAQQKKITVTGSVSTVSGTELRQSPSPSLQNAMAGRLPGFSTQQTTGRPGAEGARFFVRGQSTFVNSGSGNNPLILVDDIEFPYDQFQRLDANEIESVSILKDASTTAIYGIKGANGVVLVTTTRGKIGPPKISLRADYGLSQYTIIPNYLNAAQAATLWRQTELNSGVAPDRTVIKESDIELYRNGSSPYTHPDNDWKEILFRDFAPQLRSNVDISGGTEKARYFVSAGYLNQGGQMRDYSADLNSKYYYKRYNYRSNLDMTVNKDLTLRFDLFGNVNEINEAVVTGIADFDIYNQLGTARNTFPGNYPIYTQDGRLGYSMMQRNAPFSNNNNMVGRLMYNGFRRTFSNNMNLVLNANQKLNFITEGLNLKGLLSYGSATSNTRSLTRAGQFPSWIYLPETNSYEIGIAGNNNFRMAPPLLNAVSGTGLGTTNRTLTMQGILSYDRNFGNHHLSGLAVYNQNSKWGPNSSNSLYNFVPENTIGFTGRLSYDYKQKYLFDMNVGYNGSDRFSEDKRYGFFPAVSAGWNIASEEFFKKSITFVDQLKIRGSYGLVGNDNTGGVYAYLQSFSSANSSGLFGGGSSTNGYSIITEGALPNANVTWEKERKLDLALEFGLLNRKISGVVEYFSNFRYDILTSRGGVSDIIGQSLPNVNLGKTRNKGYELELTYKDKINDHANFSIRGTYSVARNKVVFRDDPLPLFPWQDRTNTPIGSLLKYKWTGEFYNEADLALIADGKLARPSVGARLGDLKYQDLNQDLVIDDYDKAYYGYTNIPTTTYGMQFGFGYKSFNITVLFQGVREVVSGVLAGAIEFNGPGAANAQDIHLHAWTPELGNNAKFPRLYTNYNINSTATAYSDFWAIPADYLRLKTAELSYSLPKQLISRLKVQDVRLYSSGYNLFTWTKFDKLYSIDPEINESQPGLTYPPSRTLNFGLNITF